MTSTFPRSLFEVSNATFEMENNKLCDFGVHLDYSPLPIPRNRASSVESSPGSPFPSLGSPNGTRRIRFTSESEEKRRSSILSSRYKTELCRPFAEVGSCKYGDKCQFAHGIFELRPLVRHPKYKTELCRTFHAIGFCPYGPRCHFVHNLDERETKASPPSTPATPSACDKGQPLTFQSPVNGSGGGAPQSPVLTAPPKPMRRSVSQVQFNPRFTVDEIEQNMLRFNYDRRSLDQWKREVTLLAADLDQLIIGEPSGDRHRVAASLPPHSPRQPMTPAKDQWSYSSSSCSSWAVDGGSPKRLPVFSSLA
eukprot:m.13509 g.13509  ORF g.13509 m.13509 type:complete len:309 (+) comp24947_c0_seq2:2897-3823(+)